MPHPRRVRRLDVGCISLARTGLDLLQRADGT